ncbi:hypothetical protein GT347_05750 [Xylophilus rhododendri]|uniref:Uncharacterized protein n=1 Tax=Xylophilus rhododendri TaxID=2697032 RepID=A0A857J3U8_9BURK|nr:hypothetical protein [Xylophilus rhododendri]QHI97535.1 hypothetical protein GT347_05750 [Xylophilus rhododendri]
MTASLHFVLDAQTKAELPGVANTTLNFDAGQALPAAGDSVAIAALGAHTFVVKERLFAYDAQGQAVITCHLTLASERSI